MKKVFLYLLVAIIVVNIVGCGKDDSNDNLPESLYYVKYEAKSSFNGWQSTNSLDVTYTTEKGIKQQSISGYGRGHSWEGSYGPFSKGAVLNLTIKSSNSSAEVSGKLYISRENSPFVIKEEETGQRQITLTYIIE